MAPIFLVLAEVARQWRAVSRNHIVNFPALA